MRENQMSGEGFWSDSEKGQHQTLRKKLPMSEFCKNYAEKLRQESLTVCVRRGQNDVLRGVVSGLVRCLRVVSRQV